MTRYDRLMNRIANGERILIDGATGTEIERRGVPQLDNAWNGGGALSHPDILRGVHEDYIRAGAEIVISNTFATHREALRSAGVEDQFADYNRYGVELAVEARTRMEAPDVLVGGGISYWSWADEWASAGELVPGVEEQAAIMAEAGADLIMLEMMIDIDRMLAAAAAAQKSGLPVWAGLTCTRDSAGVAILRNGDPLAAAFAALADLDVPLINIMHTEIEHVDASLEAAREHWKRPVGVYAHSARWVNNVCHYDVSVSPEEYSAHANAWLRRGVQVIGACCGLGVEHIRALKPLV